MQAAAFVFYMLAASAELKCGSRNIKEAVCMLVTE